MWIYKDEPLQEAPSGYYGFVYVISDDKGKLYYGKKAFTHRRKTKLSKKARKETGRRIKVDQKDSGWKDYWGSSKPLLEYIKKRKNTMKFSRTVLKLCRNKASLSYWETHYLFSEYVLFRDSWNSNILGRYFKNKIHE